MYSHILIATDGSELAQRGVDQGLWLAKQLGSKVTILTASDPIMPYAFSGEFATAASVTEFADYNKKQEEGAMAILSKVKAAADKMGVSADTVYMEEMRPAEAIADIAKERGCALIVMASHGRRGLGRLFLGSQTIEVLSHSAIPVLVVR
jgi:nucleotide-binding universal stress UspA family protein